LSDCSPINEKHELGLDRRETGWLYPTIGSGGLGGSKAKYERNRLTSSLAERLPEQAGRAATTGEHKD